MGKSGIFLSFGGYSEHVARFFQRYHPATLLPIAMQNFLRLFIFTCVLKFFEIFFSYFLTKIVRNLFF